MGPQKGPKNGVADWIVIIFNILIQLDSTLMVQCRQLQFVHGNDIFARTSDNRIRTVFTLRFRNGCGRIVELHTKSVQIDADKFLLCINRKGIKFLKNK